MDEVFAPANFHRLLQQIFIVCTLPFQTLLFNAFNHASASDQPTFRPRSGKVFLGGLFSLMNVAFLANSGGSAESWRGREKCELENFMKVSFWFFCRCMSSNEPSHCSIRSFVFSVAWKHRVEIPIWNSYWNSFLLPMLRCTCHWNYIW